MRTLFVFFTFSVVAAAQEGADDRTPIVDARRAAIGAELETLAGHEWAGVYRTAPGLYVKTVMVSPRNGIVLRESGCLGVYDQNYGTLARVGPVLIADWKLAGEAQRRIETVYVTIRWGNSRFLVPRGEILKFCIQARSANREFWLASFLRSTEDEEMDLTGDPELPDAYKQYWTMEHIAATVVSVGPQSTTNDPNVEVLGTVKQTVVLNVGSNHGVQPLMRFYLAERHSNSPTSLEVTAISPDECVAEACVVKWIDERITPLEPSLQYTTNLWKAFAERLDRSRADPTRE